MLIWWWDGLAWRYSISRWRASTECHDALWRRFIFLKDTTLIEINNDDECMKNNTYMLVRVIYERYIGLCHEDDLKMNTIGTSCILCVHIHRDTSPFMMMSTDAYAMMMMMIIIIMLHITLRGLLTSKRGHRQLARLWCVQGGANRLGIHTRTCGLCVEKYYTSNFVWTWGHPYDDF